MNSSIYQCLKKWDDWSLTAKHVSEIPSKNAAKHNTNKVRQEKINKNTQEISEKIYNKENYEEPYYVDAARKIDEMKKESYSYQDEVRRGTVNAEEQEKYFEELEEKEGGMLGKLKKKFFNWWTSIYSFEKVQNN